MKQLIETIKANREELIYKYFKMKKEIEVLADGMKQAKLLCSEKTYDNLWCNRTDLQSNLVNVRMAVNDLTNALNHLGESTETFWG